VAFLDGVQRLQLLAYAGSAPLFLGEIAAAVRERRGGRLRTAVESRRWLAIGRPSALAAAEGAMDGLATLALPEDEPAHPVRDLTQAGRALDRARGALELEVGAAYRRRSDAWLVIDGSLSESPDWAADPRTVGVSKSHATLPFDGADLERYLRLPSGQRTSVFAPASRSVAPVLAWAVRLWPWEDRDLFPGLVRVEVAPDFDPFWLTADLGIAFVDPPLSIAPAALASRPPAVGQPVVTSDSSGGGTAPSDHPSCCSPRTA